MTTRSTPVHRLISEALAKYDDTVGDKTLDVMVQKLAENARSGDLASFKALVPYLAPMFKAVEPPPPSSGAPRGATLITTKGGRKVMLDAVWNDLACGQITTGQAKQWMETVKLAMDITEMSEQNDRLVAIERELMLAKTPWLR